MKRDGDRTYTVTLQVRNRPGVLVRCAQIFGRRGHNIEALLVVPLNGNQEAAQMTITAFGKPDVMQQIIAQLAKLVDVISINEMEK